MPSLARKSMKFMRDVYNAAATQESTPPPIPSTQTQGFAPSQGLSSPFIQTNQAYAHKLPPPPPMQASHTANSPYTSAYPAPQLQHPEPYGTWPAQQTPTSPPSPQPVFSFSPAGESVQSSTLGSGLCLSPSTPLSSPATPQAYQTNAYQNFSQSAPDEKPPLPPRSPSHDSSTSAQRPSEPRWHGSPYLDGGGVTHGVLNSGPMQRPYLSTISSNAVPMDSGIYSGGVSSDDDRPLPPLPPRLPPRIQTQPAELAVYSQAGTELAPLPSPPSPAGPHYTNSFSAFSAGSHVHGLSGSFNTPPYTVAAERPPSRTIHLSNTGATYVAELPASTCTLPLPSLNTTSRPSGTNSASTVPSDAVELPASPILNQSGALQAENKYRQHDAPQGRPQEYTHIAVAELDSTPITPRDTCSTPTGSVSGVNSTTKYTPTASLSTPSHSSQSSDRVREDGVFDNAIPQMSATLGSVPRPQSHQGRQRMVYSALPYPVEEGGDLSSIAMPMHLDYTTR